MSLAHYRCVDYFTRKSSGLVINEPRDTLNADEVKFLYRMVLSEIVELVQTLVYPKEKAVEFVSNCLQKMQDSALKTEIKIPSSDVPTPLNINELESFVFVICGMLYNIGNLPKDLIISIDIKDCPLPTSEISLIAGQVDALVDMSYYIYNAYSKIGGINQYYNQWVIQLLDYLSSICINRIGINFDRIFYIVHKANMDKRWPDGEFHRRDDGYVMKPPTWDPKKRDQDLECEIERQIKDGAWI
jgi:predicted HAD superfamily Cof-like phosphohydrolase